MTLTRPVLRAGWLEECLAALASQGYAIIEGVLSPAFLDETRAAMRRVEKAIVADVGAERLRAAGEAGVLRLMMKYEPFFFRYLEVPEMLRVVDAVLSPTAILHLQNGFILPPATVEQASLFQRRWHQDFPRFMNGYMASLNVMFAISDFTPESGATLVVPGTHQRARRPSQATIDASARPALCAAGAMLVFDSTLWHCAGANLTHADRLAINHQFVRSFLKQQLDYVRALGEETVLSLPARSQQLLGAYVRVPASLDDYYRPAEARLYRPGQG
ncbi:MAG: phytanoyl-CoA dioxygenase family protein [Pseudomonadota bacterium]